MKSIAICLAFLLFVVASAVCAEPLPPGNHELSLRHDGLRRYYLVHVPPQASAGRPLAVVMAFHGGGGDPNGMQNNYGIDAVADREGFIVAYPAGTGIFRRKGLTWNAGECCGYAIEHNIDDVGFTKAVLSELEARIPVDRSRVYATGHSNGAMLTWRLAAEIPELFAAIAPVAGCIAAPASAPHVRIPILCIHSMDDPLALYRGGRGTNPMSLGAMIGKPSLHSNVAEALAVWARYNGCSPDSSIRISLGQATDRAELLAFGSLPGSDSVLHWRLHGSGHSWPGQKPMLPERMMGPPCRLFNASEEIWSFFKGHAR